MRLSGREQQPEGACPVFRDELCTVSNKTGRMEANKLRRLLHTKVVMPKKTAKDRDYLLNTSRFIVTYNELLDRGYIKNGIDFCEKTGISSSMLTEIRKGRSGAGENTIAATLRAFPVVNELFIRGGLQPVLKEPKKTNSLAKQILELKELVDQGIITESEFERGKKKILK
jgi:hypothetical protein